MDKWRPDRISENLIIRDNLSELFSDIFTPDAINSLERMSAFIYDIKELMEKRIKRRMHRIHNKERIGFLDPAILIPRCSIKVQDAREGKFEGSEIPDDLQRQWIQGTGPAAKPNAPVESSLRNVS